MTEEEAKTKWCPMARVVAGHDEPQTAANRWPEDGDEKATQSNPFGTDNACLGSQCMWWRWTTFSEHAVQRHASKALAEAYIESLKEYAPPKLPQIGGYCGMAGAP